MGQYHRVVNLDKKEFLDPHQLAAGLKLWEQIANHPGTGPALLVLLAVSNGRGGGDLRADDPEGMIGRWGGDRIAVIGDYAKAHDLDPGHYAEQIYDACTPEEERDDEEPSCGWYRDITPYVAKILESELGGTFVGEGWKDWKENPERGW
jgi:hypothetical protein